MAELSVLSVLGLLATPVIQGLVTATGESAAGLLARKRPGVVRKKMLKIKEDFEDFKTLLSCIDRPEHAGQLDEGERVVKRWIERVRSEAQRVEDVLDDHMYRAFAGAGQGMERMAKEIAHLPKSGKAYRRTAKELGKLEPEADEIRRVYNQWFDALVAKYAAHAPPPQRALPAPTPNEYFFRDKIREGDAKQLKTWIKEAPAGSSTRTAVDERSITISVWGAGGQGKTTLVRKIYSEEQKSGQFDCWAWVNVSRYYRVAELLASLAAQLCDGEIDPGAAGGDACAADDDDSRSLLIDRIQLALEGRRYLVVFDDVWEGDFWKKIKLHVQDGNRSSRIIVTTRDETVASALARPGWVLKINRLATTEASSLFNRRLSWSNQGHDLPGELRRWVQYIVHLCEGNPLAIVAAAMAMSSRGREENVWERASSTLGLRLHENGGHSDSVLMHSYYDLPVDLKRCFLYCAIFPEGRPIKRKLLIRLWVAEGFIELEANGGKTKEDVAQGYLEDLVAKNMLQVATFNENGRVKACTIHDEYRKAALVILRKQNFLTVHEVGQPVAWGPDRNTRRLSLPNGVSTDLRDSDDIELLRSMFVFAQVDGGVPLGSLLSWKYRLLRVLDLSNLPITELPSRLFELYNLRYLGLRNTKVGEDAFSKKLQNLQQLQTLDLWNTEVKSLPRNLLKLQNLEHLMISRRLHSLDCRDMKYRNFLRLRGLKAPKGIWGMENLRTLKSVKADEDLVKNLHRMEHLRTLSIANVRAEHCWEILEGVSKMSSLQCLTLKAKKGKNMVLKKSMNTAPPLKLQKLVLNGAFNEVPGWFQKLENLTHMYLFESQTSGGILLRELHKLENLAFLVLDNAFARVEQLQFGTGSFPKLRILYLDNLKINQVRVDSGALPVLEKLYVSRCESMGTDWQGMENLSSLRELFLRERTRNLEDFLVEKLKRSQLNVTLRRLA